MNHNIRPHLQTVHSTILVSRIIGGILQVVMFTFVAREIGATRFGPMIAGLVTVQLIGTLLEFGFGALVMSQKFFQEKRHLVGTLLATTVALAFIQTLVGLLIFLFIPTQNRFLSAISILLLWGSGEKLSNLGLSLAISKRDAREVRRNILSRKILTFCGFCIISFLGPWNSEKFCFFLSVTSITGGIVSIFRFRNYFSDINLKNCIKIFQLGIPFYANSVVNQLRNLDVFFLNFFVSPVAAGNYALAFRFSQPFSIPMSTLAQTGITAFSSRDRILRQAFLIRYSNILKVSMFFVFLVFLIPMESIAREYLPTFSELSVSLKIQCMAFIAFGIISIETSILQGAGKEKFLAKFSFFWIALTLFLIVAGGSYDGVVGSSIGLLLGNSLQSIYLLKIRKKALSGSD